MKSEQLLRDPEIAPTPEVLELELGKIYPVLQTFMLSVESVRFGFTPEWRYYKDGHAWLCKLTFKKKTVAWMSVWSDCFKVAFYFTEKTGDGIATLKIRASLKRAYGENPAIGRLKPLVVEIKRASQLDDVYVLLQYKAERL